MAQLTDPTKIARVNEAFGKVAQQYIVEGMNKRALTMVNALETLTSDSKVLLFDILTKPE